MTALGLGLCAHDSILNPATAAQEMAALKALGADHIRIGAVWGLVEATKGQMTGYPTNLNALPQGFENVDAAVNAALGAGLEVLLLLNAGGPNLPGWASQTSSSDYANFCKQAALRFKPGGSAISSSNAGKGVLRYELLNEVNVGNNWNQGGWFAVGGGVNVSQIAAFHKAAYAAIKAVQPAAQVGGWAMAACTDWAGSWWSGGPAQVLPSNFVNQMIAAGCGQVDFISCHPYTMANDFTTFQPPSSTQQFIAELSNIHNVLVTKGMASLPIDCTEWGYSSADFSDTVCATYMQEEWQILHAAPFTSLIRDHYLYCGRNWWYPGQTYATNNREMNFGALQNDFTHKPVGNWLVTL